MSDEIQQVDPFNVRGTDGVLRDLSEHYDGMRDVEQDCYGAWLAIQNQHTRIKELEAKLAQAVDAFAILEDALQEAGDDYPGSKMQEWCQQQVKRARATLAAIKGEAE
jgi:hypothetical protein